MAQGVLALPENHSFAARGVRNGAHLIHPSTMNQFADARDSLLDANDEILGSPQTAKVVGKIVRCIIEEISTDEILIAGGVAESGGFRLSCIPKESLSPKPEKGDSVEARDQDLDLLSIVERNDATYEITAGALTRGEK